MSVKVDEPQKKAIADLYMSIEHSQAKRAEHKTKRKPKKTQRDKAHKNKKAWTSPGLEAPRSQVLYNRKGKIVMSKTRR